jgi:uncharacterized protein (TIGR03066 family)
MKALCAAAMGLAMVFALTGSARADDAEKLLGKWEVTKSTGDTPVGTVVDFQKGGKMTAAVTLDGKELKLTGTYKLDGKKLKINLTLNDQKVEHDFTVKFKGKEEIELEDNDKKVDTLKKK